MRKQTPSIATKHESGARSTLEGALIEFVVNILQKWSVLADCCRDIRTKPLLLPEVVALMEREHCQKVRYL